MPRKKPKRKPARRKPGTAPLTPEQQVFVDEYLIDLNATAAYRRAFPRATYHTARVEGNRLLAKPAIREEVRAARLAQQQRTRVTADRVIRELARVGFSDVFDLFDADGRLLPARLIPLETRKAVAAVKVRKERTTTRTSGQVTTTETECEVEYKLWPKVEALAKLCAHLGLTTEITPLDALLAAIPGPVAEQVRQALAGTLPGGGGPKGR